MDDAEKERRGLLKDEWIWLQDQYEDFDRRSLTIKGWVSAGSAAALAIAFKDAGTHGRAVAIFIILLSACFWYLEARWKLFQYAHRTRIRVIEAYFRNDSDIYLQNPSPLQSYHSWFTIYQR